jgi:RNA polymerase sigma factor (sigma-70 family)
MIERAADPPPEPLSSDAQALFASAFREHRQELLSFVRRRVDSDAEAADITQEAYLCVLRYRERQDLGTLKALLYQITSNLLAMRARTAANRHTADHVPIDTEQPIAANIPTMEQQLADKQRLAQILSAIKGLPEKCRNVFLLSRFHGLSNPEIARRCGISVRMVEKQITKALAACHARVRD